jgi:hypothetical protein
MAYSYAIENFGNKKEAVPVRQPLFVEVCITTCKSN